MIWDWKIWNLHRVERKTRVNRSRTRTVDIHTKNNEKYSKLEPTRCYNSLRIARRWIAELRRGRKLDNSTLQMNLLWKETVLLSYAEDRRAKEFSTLEIYKQFLTIISRSDQWPELKFSNLQELWWLKCKYRDNNQEIRSLGCAYREEIKNTHDNFSYWDCHQHLETVSSQQSQSCGPPRAQVTSGRSPVRYEAAPDSTGFSQRVWKSIPASALTNRECEFVSISRHFTKILRHTGCHESDGAVRENKRGLMPEVVPLTNLEWCIVRVAMERLSTFVHCKATVVGSQAIQTRSLWHRYRWFEGPQIPHEHFFPTANQSWTMVHGAGGLRSRSTRQACFFSHLNPQESSSRQRTIDWTGTVHEPGAIQAYQSPAKYRANSFKGQTRGLMLVVFLTNPEWSTCEDQNGTIIDIVSAQGQHRNSERSIGQDHSMNQGWFCTRQATAQIVDSNFDFNQRRAQDAQWLDCSVQHMRASAVDNVRISGQPEEPQLLHEKEAKVFLISSLTEQMDDDLWFAQESFTEECRNCRIQSCTLRRFRKSWSARW